MARANATSNGDFGSLTDVAGLRVGRARRQPEQQEAWLVLGRRECPAGALRIVLEEMSW